MAWPAPDENFRATNLFAIGIQCAHVKMIEQGLPLDQKNIFLARYFF
jgi:hypothetical protein